MSSPVPRRAFNFQISKPIMTGYMQKQGALHKAFKRRFFVLYPGFLVYYDREDKWQSDVHRDTLGGRLNAIKLKGGRIEKAKHAPKGCHYGITVISPDPHNKRSEYLFNCQSNEERFQWMQHILSAIPSSSSNLKVKNTAPETPNTAEKPAAPAEKSKEAPQAEEKPVVNPVRQETVDEAAMMAVGGLEDVEDELTDMDEVLGPRTDDAKSSSSGGSSPRSSLSPEEVTHYTIQGDYVVSSASVQANSDTSTPADSPVPDKKNTQQTDEEVKENGHDTAVAEKEETHSKEEEKEEAPLSKEENEEEAHSKEEAPLSKEEEKEEAPNSKEENKEEEHLKEEEKKEEADSNEEGKEAQSKEEEVVHSKEVVVPASQSPELVITVAPEPGSNDKLLTSSDDDSEGEEAPPATSPTDTTSTSTEGDRQPDSANSEPSSPATNGDENGLRSSPDLDARRPTGIKSFVEKRGFLYKMGGNFKTWKLRYFVLQPGMFTYYKKDPKEKPLGEVKLKNLQIMFPKPNERTYSSYQFTVHTESQWNRRSDYVIAAKSDKEMKEWIDAFKLASGLKRLSSEAAAHRDAATVASSAVRQ